MIRTDMRPHEQIAVEYEKEAGLPFTDSLTGLFNHGFFQVSLEREIKRSERHRESFALVLIDVDSFSFYNRRYGSAKGDRVLKQVAEAVKKSIRESDLAARYSGDIFAVMLVSCDTEFAASTAERIRKSVEDLFGGEPTVSVGLASYPSDAVNREPLIEKAQEALLQAKLGGKNRTYTVGEYAQALPETAHKVLVVDDEPLNVKLLQSLLSTADYEVITASSGEEALSIISKIDVDLVLLDIMMPGLNGYEVCQRIKQSDSMRLLPVVMITALDDTESRVKGIEVGADDFLTKPPIKVELLARVKSLVKVKALNSKLISIEKVLFSLARTVEVKDKYTEGHSWRVASTAMQIWKKMNLPVKSYEAIRIGGVLHDIGKIGISGEILNKPGPLSADEYQIIKGHPDFGHRICLPLKNNLGVALDVIRHHHEKLDGSGYPDGLKGDEISLEARVMAVSDVYDALISDRAYRKRLSRADALDTLRNDANNQRLDRDIVQCLTEMVSATRNGAYPETVDPEIV
jgi:putative two-component system response regulator